MIRNDIRNIAIIAHVDHGKTTLVDGILRQTGFFRHHQEAVDCFLDSNALERERGITILAKNIAVDYAGTKINIIDTPGHADFGGEVERVLKLADGVLLLVDAFDGPMPQTRFVLQKALELKLRPIVVVNKCDRRDARPLDVVEEVTDLILELATEDWQLDFPVIFASGRQGRAGTDPENLAGDLRPLLDAVLAKVPAPGGDVEGSLQVLVANFEHNDFLGRIAIGRVVRGRIRADQSVAVLKRDGVRVDRRVRQLSVFDGQERVAVPEAFAGDIVAVVGIEGVGIGDTIADPQSPEALPVIAVEEPTISMIFSANDSPLRGQEGQHVTSRKLRDRLYREAEANVAMRIADTDSPDSLEVSGRGVLHLGILIENMRREGYELLVSRPRVIYKDVDGERHEPIEEAIVEVPPDMTGRVMGLFGGRRGELRTMETRGERARMYFVIPSRTLIGLRNQLMTATQGQATFFHRLTGYAPYKGSVVFRKEGVQIADRDGVATTYALDALQERGPLFVSAGTKVYEGMIVGEHCHESDLVVNITREKQLTNFRVSGHDKNAMLAPPVVFTVEEALEYIDDDELVEVTPVSLRMRKRVLTAKTRKRTEEAERARADG